MKAFYMGMALTLSLLLAGCGIGGYSMTGMVLEKDLKSIKPYLQYWEKPGMTVEGRIMDSKECGGLNDSLQFTGTRVLKAAHRPGETERETETRLRQDWVACMREKGYRYVAVTPTK
jgi:hypothetical protein